MFIDIVELDDVREKMEKALRVLADDLATVGVGRATPALVEKVLVDAYETKMPVVELATITAPEPNQLIISPFDQSIIKNIQLAIFQDRELKLSAIIDEQVIRVQIPPLTAERRKEFVKLLGQKLETGRMAVRQIRQGKRTEIKRAFDEKEIGEDEKFRWEKELQELTDEFMKRIEEMGERKKTELRSV